MNEWTRKVLNEILMATLAALTLQRTHVSLFEYVYLRSLSEVIDFRHSKTLTDTSIVEVFESKRCNSSNILANEFLRQRLEQIQFCERVERKLKEYPRKILTPQFMLHCKNRLNRVERWRALINWKTEKFRRELALTRDTRARLSHSLWKVHNNVC